MRKMVFKMERPGLLEAGQEITVTEGLLPSNYYYIIDPALAMSANIPFRYRNKITAKIRRCGGNGRRGSLKNGHVCGLDSSLNRELLMKITAGSNPAAAICDAYSNFILPFQNCVPVEK